MKINCGPDWLERWTASFKWHFWFAWHPVRVGPRDCRWLEIVERRRVGRLEFTSWEYRPLNNMPLGD